MAQFPPYRLSVTDNLRTGNAVSADRTKAGIPIAGDEGQAVLVLSLGAPSVAAATTVAAAQAVAGAGNLTLASTTVTLDVPRCVSIVSANAGDTTQTATVYGRDIYGASLREVITFNGTTPVLGVKAFKYVTQVAISAATAGNVSVGQTGKLGLPYRPVIGGFIRGILGENTADAGTYVAPSRVTATGTTVDVRGTYLPAGTLNGTNVFKVAIAVQNGPADTDAFGVAQFNG